MTKSHPVSRLPEEFLPTFRRLKTLLATPPTNVLAGRGNSGVRMSTRVDILKAFNRADRAHEARQRHAVQRPIQDRPQKSAAACTRANSVTVSPAGGKIR